MENNLEFSSSELHLLKLSDDQLLDAAVRSVAESTYFEIEPTPDKLKEHVRDWVGVQSDRLRAYLCSDELINKTTVLPPSEVAIIILDIVKSVVMQDPKVVVSTFLVLKYAVLTCAKHGLRKFCASCQ